METWAFTLVGLNLRVLGETTDEEFRVKEGRREVKNVERRSKRWNFVDRSMFDWWENEGKGKGKNDNI